MLIAASIGPRSSFAMILLLVVAAIAGEGSLTSALRGASLEVERAGRPVRSDITRH